MLSIIIPSRNERFLKKTIEDILAKAEGGIEIIAILDGYWPSPQDIVNNPKVIYLHRGSSRGMRAGINAGVAIAKEEFIMKIDGHCLLDQGFDVKFIADYQENSIIIPRRKRLDAENWQVQDVGKPDVDYELLSYPDDPSDFGGAGLNGKIWTDRILQKKDIMIDDTPASQGSCWFTKRSYFYDLELMDEESYGPFWNESQELALKSVLSGGKYLVNKKTWYAHLHKGKVYGRGYAMDNSWLTKGRNQTMRFFAGEKVWHKQIYPLSYLIEKFMPMPGWTPENLEELKKRESINYVN